MSNDAGPQIFGLGFVFGFIVGISLTGFLLTVLWKNEALNHNAAHYNTKTGSFEWNDPLIPEKL